ncbi:MAG TPA: hypothetical protein VL588_08210 [Bdellovibrionota bacterium]|nr:hypothetical protein [Bdellovibrionota bacterium]
MTAPTIGRGDAGQSLVEFLIMLPIVVSLATLMVRVNTVIQVSIVNQRYARAQALFLAYNSPYYPELRLRKRMRDLDSNELILGVSNKNAPLADSGQEYEPDPVIIPIVSRGKPVGDDQSPEPTQRGRVRVRSTVTLCTQVNVIQQNGEFRGYDGSSSIEDTPMSGDITFPFCRGVFSEGGNP